jgi:hypothetical protein
MQHSKHEEIHMETWILDIVIGVTIVVVIVALVSAYERNRTRHLRERFGPEYDRAVAVFGDRRRAESELTQREGWVRDLHIRPLSEKERKRFKEEWRLSQARFAHDPDGALEDADWLFESIMRARGYPSVDLEERMDNVSAAYPQGAADYRRAVAAVGLYRQGSASAQELRRAFLIYQELLNNMLEGLDEESERAA